MLLLLALLLALLLLVILMAVFWDHFHLDTFDNVPLGPSLQRPPYFVTVGHWPWQRRVLIISRPEDVAVFAKEQAFTLRRGSFRTVLGVGWAETGASMLGGCDFNRHGVLLAVFRRPLNASKVAALSQEIIAGLDEFLTAHVGLNRVFSLRSGCFDPLFVNILSRVVVGLPADERLHLLAAHHREIVVPLLALPAARLPLAQWLFSTNLTKVKLHMAEFSAWLDSLDMDLIEGSAVSWGRKALNSGEISREEFVHTIYELLTFNLDIFDAEVRAVLAHFHRLEEFQSVDAFIAECARVQPSIQVSFPESLGRDCSLGPRGLMVAIDVMALNESKTKPFSAAGAKSSMVYRFGLGARSCIGQNIARLVLKEFVAALKGRGGRVVIREFADTSQRKSALPMVRVEPNAYLTIEDT